MSINLSELFDTTFRNAIIQMDRYGIIYGRREHFAISVALDVLLTMMRKVQANQRVNAQSNSVQTQVPEEGVGCSSEDIVLIQISNPPTPVALFANVAVQQLPGVRESGMTNEEEL